jgi:hypothetical protein
LQAHEGHPGSFADAPGFRRPNLDDSSDDFKSWLANAAEFSDPKWAWKSQSGNARIHARAGLASGVTPWLARSLGHAYQDVVGWIWPFDRLDLDQAHACHLKASRALLARVRRTNCRSPSIFYGNAHSLAAFQRRHCGKGRTRNGEVNHAFARRGIPGPTRAYHMCAQHQYDLVPSS